MSFHSIYIRVYFLACLFLLAPASGWAQADPTTPPPLPGNKVVTVSGTSSGADTDYSSVSAALRALTNTANGVIKLNISTTLEGTHTLNEGVKIDLNGLRLTCAAGTSLTAATDKRVEIANTPASTTGSLTGSLSFSGGLFVGETVEMKDVRVYQNKELVYRVPVTLPAETGTFSNLLYGSAPVTHQSRSGRVLCCWLPESATPQTVTFAFNDGSKTTDYQTDPVIVIRHLQSPLPIKEKVADTTKPTIKITPDGAAPTDYLKLDEGLQQLATTQGSALLLQNGTLMPECSFTRQVSFDLSNYNLTGNAQAGLKATGTDRLHIKSATNTGSMSGTFRITDKVLVDHTVTLTANMLIDGKQVYRIRVILPDASYTHYKYNNVSYTALTSVLNESGKQVAYLWLPGLSTPSTFQVAKNATGSEAKTRGGIVIEANHNNEVDMKEGDIQAIVNGSDGSEVGKYTDFHEALNAIQATTGRSLILQSNVSLTGTNAHAHALSGNIVSIIDLNRRSLYGENCSLEASGSNSCYRITDATGTGSITGTLHIKGSVYVGKEIAASKIGNVLDVSNSSSPVQVYRLLVTMSEAVSDGFYSYSLVDGGAGSTGTCYIKDRTACLWFPLTQTINSLSFIIDPITTYSTSSVRILASHSNTAIARLPGAVAKIGSQNYTTLKEAFGAVSADNTEIEILADATLNENISLSHTVKMKNDHAITIQNGTRLACGSTKSFYIYSSSGKGTLSGNFEIDGEVYVSGTVGINGTVTQNGATVYRSILLLPTGTTAATCSLGTPSNIPLFFSNETDALGKVLTYAWLKSESNVKLTATITVPSTSTLQLESITVLPLHSNRFDMTAGEDVVEFSGQKFRSFSLALSAANAAVSGGGTITLLQALVLRENQSISQEISINLAGFTLTTTADATFTVADDKVLTVQDLSTGNNGTLYGTLRLAGAGCVYVDTKVHLAGTVVRDGLEVYRTMVQVPGTPGDAIIDYSDATKITPAGKAWMKKQTACLWLSPTLLEHDLTCTIGNESYEVTLVPALPGHQTKVNAYKVVAVSADTEFVGSDYQDCNVVVKAGAVLTIPEGSTLTSLHRLVLEDGSQVVCEKAGDVLVTDGIIYRRAFTTADRWESFSLPFNARRITAIQGGELIEMQPYQGNGTGGHFWLKTLAEDGSFQYVTEEKIRANVGYILAVPNNLAGMAPTGENVIDFVSPANQFLQRAQVPAVAPEASGFKQSANGTYRDISLAVPYYLLNAEGTAYERQIPAANSPATLSPFRSYLLADKQTTATRSNLRIGFAPTSNEIMTPPHPSTSSVKLMGLPGLLLIESEEAGSRVTVYSAGGKLFSTRLLPAGTTSIPLPSGIYFVNGTKLYIP